MFSIEMLPADEGDCLWIEYGSGTNPRRMIIDAGRKKAYKALIDRLGALDQAPGPAVDLFVMTHIDDDHIFGGIPLFADARIDHQTFGDIWYNCYSHLDHESARKPEADMLGPKNGEIFAALLLKGGFRWNEAFDGGATIVVPNTGNLPRIELDGDLTLTLLSPTWESLTVLKGFWERELEDMEPGDAEAALEIFSDRRDLQPDVLGGLIDVEDLIENPYKHDTTAPNGSSIAFLAEHDGRAVLFTGDAHPPILEASITRLLKERGQSVLALDAFKISHHGSKNNTSVKLLDLIDCRRFLISTNGTRHDHPDAETIARILYRNHQEEPPTELYFNYQTNKHNTVWDDEELQEKWNYRTHYPPGSLVSL